MTNGRGNDIWGRGIGMEGEWWAVPTLQEWQAGGGDIGENKVADPLTDVRGWEKKIKDQK